MKDNNNLRVAIYLRLSDEDGNKINKYDNSESIKNQRNMLMDEILKNDNYFFVGEYCDENLSGAGTYRPEFERMIKDCKNGKIDIILSKTQSRFSRDIEIVEKYLHNKFLEWNVRFIGLSDNVDTANESNKKARQINGLTNEWFLEDTSKNIRSAFKIKMKRGEFISPFAPFGYQVSNLDNNKIIVDLYASSIVKKIFYLYLKGLSFTGIASYLNKSNIPSPSKYKNQMGIKLNIVSSKPIDDIKWSLNSVKSILTNEIYLGHLIQGKRTTTSYKNKKVKKLDPCNWIRYNNTHEPIIDEEVFNKVKVEISIRKKPCKINNIIHIFSGKVFCMKCNKCMKKKVSSKNDYLCCSNNKSICNNKSCLRYDFLEKIILAELNKLINKYFDYSILCNLFNAHKVNSYSVELKQLLYKIDSTDKMLIDNKLYFKSIYEDKINNNISIDQFNYLSSEYSKYIKELKNKKDFFKKEYIELKNKIDLYDNNSICLNKYRRIQRLNRFIINEFIKDIYIGSINTDGTRNIKIYWNY